jgi:septal ring factor EnvC (AmiA/AmiB activator)
VSKGKEWVDTLRACHLEFALRVQVLDAVDTALEESLDVASEIARAALEITKKEDESFRAAKAIVNASIGKVDETIANIEKELVRAYNQTTDYKRHLSSMRSAIEGNLDRQREVLYKSALAMLK